MPIADARRLAHEKGLVLIEEHPDHEPPGCSLAPLWIVDRVKHYFRGPAESLTPDLPPMGQAYLEFDEDGWNSRSVYVFGAEYFSSYGLDYTAIHPRLHCPVISDQPLGGATCECT
jgi:hypothetical protein